jgi:DNA primase catalytic core
VELKRAGAGSWKGLCPFHGEKTPSFSVNEKGFFYCFGCHEKGDAITFLTKIEQRPFMDVLHDLAMAAGIDLDVRPLSPAERQARQRAESERERMFRAMELAAAFFEDQYASPAGAAARAYAKARHRLARASAFASATRRRAGTAVVAPRRTQDPAVRPEQLTSSASTSVAVTTLPRRVMFGHRSPAGDRLGGRVLDPE